VIPTGVLIPIGMEGITPGFAIVNPAGFLIPAVIAPREPFLCNQLDQNSK
jgi:hypothetical protein